MFVEWSALGSFVLLGDVAAQKLEHISKPPPAYTLPLPLPTTITPSTPAIKGCDGSCMKESDANLHTCVHVHEKMHHIITSANNEDGDNNRLQVNFTRLLAAAGTGFLFVAPICMVWFPLLHRFMGKYLSHLVEGSFRYVSTKVVLENACLAGPVFLGYFAIPAVIEGGDDWWPGLVSRLESDFTSTLATDVSFWCVASPINYKFIPVRYACGIICWRSLLFLRIALVYMRILCLTCMYVLLCVSQISTSLFLHIRRGGGSWAQSDGAQRQ